MTAERSRLDSWLSVRLHATANGHEAVCKRRSCLDDSQLTGADGRLCAVPHVELGEDVGDVVLDGALGKTETIRNLLVRRAGPKERQDVTLAGREWQHQCFGLRAARFHQPREGGHERPGCG